MGKASVRQTVIRLVSDEDAQLAARVRDVLPEASDRELRKHRRAGTTTCAACGGPKGIRARRCIKCFQEAMHRAAARARVAGRHSSGRQAASREQEDYRRRVMTNPPPGAVAVEMGHHTRGAGSQRQNTVTPTRRQRPVSRLDIRAERAKAIERSRTISRDYLAHSQWCRDTMNHHTHCMNGAPCHWGGGTVLHQCGSTEHED